MNPDTPPAGSGAREVVLALLCGAATWLGIKFAQRLDDPYSEPRLTVSSWIDQHRGGDPA